MEKKSTIEVIEIIGKLWPLVLTLFIVIVTILKWKTIWNFVKSMTGIRLKKGETEIEFRKEEPINDLDSNPAEIASDSTKSQNPVSTEIPEEDLSLSECYKKLVERNIDDADRIFTQIQSRAKPIERTENEFTFLFYKYLNGLSDESVFKEKLSKELPNDQKSIGYKYLGLAFKSSRQFMKAIECFNTALDLTVSESETSKIVVYISQTHLDNQDPRESEKTIINYLPKILEDQNKADLYYQLSKVYEISKDKVLKAIALEKASTLKGNSISYLFDSAYSYSETDFIEASIFQYYNLLTINGKHASSLNNQAVNFKHKELKLKSCEYYKRAIEEENSLAASNLAYIYINAGLAEEANSLFEHFIKKTDVDKNLINAQSKLVTEKDNEQQKANQLFEDGKSYSKFFNKYAMMYFERSCPTDIEESGWNDGVHDNVMVKIKGGIITIEWEEPNTIIGSNDQFKISGQLINSACPIIYDFPTSKSPDPWELIVDKNKKPTRIYKKFTGYCWIDLSSNTIEIIYKSEETYHKIKFSKGPSA